MTTHICIGIIISIIILSGCGKLAKRAETPKEALQAIIKLYENRDFDALVRSRF